MGFVNELSGLTTSLSVARPFVHSSPLQCPRRLHSNAPSFRKREQRRQTALTAEAISHTDIKRQARNAPQREQCRSNRGGEESFLSNSLSGWRPRITPRRKRRGERWGMALKIMNARSALPSFLFVRGVSPSLPSSLSVCCHCHGG